MCGGTVRAERPNEQSEGLSPRVRGNPACKCAARFCIRSIPACAGEPVPMYLVSPLGPVYPRVCGGTEYNDLPTAAAHGLSPRVRGNLGCAVVKSTSRRSIPACAGEPPQSRSARGMRRVYPRVCGGTQNGSLSTPLGTGLSPRVRGNLLRTAPCSVLVGSIPACAGEP